MRPVTSGFSRSLLVELEVLALAEVLEEFELEVHAVDFGAGDAEGELVGFLATGGHRILEDQGALVVLAVEDVVVFRAAAVVGGQIRETQIQLGARVVLHGHRHDGDLTIGRLGAGCGRRCSAGADVDRSGDVGTDLDLTCLSRWRVSAVRAAGALAGILARALARVGGSGGACGFVDRFAEHSDPEDSEDNDGDRDDDRHNTEDDAGDVEALVAGEALLDSGESDEAEDHRCDAEECAAAEDEGTEDTDDAADEGEDAPDVLRGVAAGTRGVLSVGGVRVGRGELIGGSVCTCVGRLLTVLVGIVLRVGVIGVLPVLVVPLLVLVRLSLTVLVLIVRVLTVLILAILVLVVRCTVVRL